MSFPALRLQVVGPDGSYGRPLTEVSTIDLTCSDGEANSIAFTYDARHESADLLDHIVTVALLVGGVEYPDMRFVLDDSGRDEVLEEETVAWSALSILGQLAYGVVLPDLQLGDTGGTNLGLTTPGKALRTLIERCQARGALTWVTLGFSDNLDSAGQSWASLAGEYVEAGKTILDVVTGWHTRRVASARMDGTTLRLYTYGGQGVDRSQLASGMLLRGRDLLDGPWNSNTRDARSVMWAYGEIPDSDPDSAQGTGDQRDTDQTASGGKPLLISETNQSAKDRFGTREGWLSQQQIESESQLRAIASGSLALTNRARDAYAYKLTLGTGPDRGPLPLIDYAKGDTMQVRVAENNRQMRVRSITINQDAAGDVTGSAAFGDRMMDADEELARALERLQQLTGQSMDGGAFNAPIVTYDKLSDSAAVDTVRVKRSSLTEAQWNQLLQLGYRGIYGDDDQPNDPSIYVPRAVLVAVKAGGDVSSTGGGVELVRVQRSSVSDAVWAKLLDLGYVPVAPVVDEDGDGQPDDPMYDDPAAAVYVPRDVLDSAINGADLTSIDQSEKWVRIVKATTPTQMWDKFLELGYRPITVAAGTPYDVLYIPKTIYAQVAAGTGLSSNYDEAEDFTPPQPPTNLTASSFALTDGLYLGSSTIRLSWTASTSSDVAWYELAYQDLEFAQDQVSGFWREIPQTTQTVASIERLKPGFLYRFRVRAVDGAYNVSPWQLLEVRAAVDTVAPTQRPTAPTVTTSMYNTIRVEWDGRAEGGVAFSPDDVRTVEVHRSTASGYIPTAGTLITTMTVVGRNTASTLIYGDVGQTHYVRLVPVDVAGNVGNRAATCSAQATGATADVFASGLPDRSVNPETVAWNDLDNMVPDGSFERADYRTDAVSTLMRTSADNGATWPLGKVAATTFSDVGLAVPPVVTAFPGSAWGGAPAPTSYVNGNPRRTGGPTVLAGLWTTLQGPRAIDTATLYRVEVRFKLLQDSGNVSGLTTVQMGIGPRRYDSASNTYRSRAYDGTESTSILTDPLLRTAYLSTTANAGEYVGILWVRGTSSTVPAGGAGLSFDNPAAVPTGTTHLAITVKVGDAGDSSIIDVLSSEIRNIASPAFDGRWVLDFAPYASNWQRLDLLQARPSKGSDVFYVVGRAKLVGSRTNQPVIAMLASWRDDSGREIYAAQVSKSGGFTHDGWFQFEGRLSLGTNRPDLRSGQIDTVDVYLAVFNVGTGQTLRVDGLEIRRAQTNVLIADLAVDDAKIASASISKLTAGTMTAEMVVGNAIRTPQIAGGVSTVGLYGRAGGGKGYAYFGALDAGGVTTVEINGETGSATFGGTITAAELTGAIKVRYPTGTGYMELTTSANTPQGFLPGLQTVYPSDTYVRTPSSLTLAGTVASLNPSKVHVAGTAANQLSFSSLQQQIVVARGTNTAAADVDSVVGRTLIDHPYSQFMLTDQSYRGTLGRYPVMWWRSGAFNGAAGIGIDHFNTANWGDVIVDVLKVQDPYSGLNISYAQMRGTSFTNQSFTTGKRDIGEFDLGSQARSRFSALALIADHPSHVYRRHDQGDEWWFVGPMADDMPDWLTRAGGFGAHDLAGILWRAVEELVEVVEGNRRTIASLVGRTKEVLPMSATKELIGVEIAKQVKLALTPTLPGTKK